MEKIIKKNNSISISGNIKGISDVNNIKKDIESYTLKSGDKFTIEIENSFAMPSALIGYLMKLAEQDKIDFSLHIGDSRLSELLDDLGLTKAFNIKTKSFA